jgi:hypothetical protein
MDRGLVLRRRLEKAPSSASAQAAAAGALAGAPTCTRWRPAADTLAATAVGPAIFCCEAAAAADVCRRIGVAAGAASLGCGIEKSQEEAAHARGCHAPHREQIGQTAQFPAAAAAQGRCLLHLIDSKTRAVQF